jgi:hypothetical protein
VEAADVINSVAIKAAKAAFWDALAEFAATAHVPTWARTAALTMQPFISWHVVVQQGTGLRVGDLQARAITDRPACCLLLICTACFLLCVLSDSLCFLVQLLQSGGAFY